MKVVVIVLLFAMAMFNNSSVMAQEYYTLSEIREQASAGWSETYEDKYGRRILIDIDVDVLGEAVAPVLRVGWKNKEGFKIHHNNPYETLKYAKQKQGGTTRYIFESYNGEKIEMDKAYGAEYGNNLTPQEAFAFFAEYIEQQGYLTEEFLYEQPKVFNVLCSVNENTDDVVAPAFYVTTLWPLIRKMPVITHVNWAFEKRAGPICTPAAIYRIRNKEEFTITINSFVEKELLAEDIPLCSLRKIIQSIEKKIEAGHIQKVMSLRFGYAVYNEPSIASKRMADHDVEDWYLVPAWVLECGYSANPKKDYDKNVNAKLVVLNAQTGEMLDPLDKSLNGHGDSRYRGFISWESIGEAK